MWKALRTSLRRLVPERLQPKATPEWSQLVLLGATGMRMVTSLVMTIMAGRMLTPAEFGGFALVTTAFNLAHEFTDMGTGNVAVRTAARAPETEREVLEHLLGLRLILSIVAAIACASFALARTEGVLRGMLLATSFTLVFSYVSALSMVFQLRQAQVMPAILSVFAQIAAVAAAAILLFMPVNHAYVPGVVVGREVLVIAGTVALAVGVLGFTPYPRINKQALRTFFGVALVVALATLAYHFQLLGGIFFVQVMRPADEVGAFGAALRPLSSIMFLPWLVMLPLVPLLSALAGSDRGAFVRQSQAATDLLIGLGAVMAVASFQMAHAALAFLYGTRFSEGALSAVETLRWLALPLGASYAVAAVSTILLGDHREWSLLAVSAAGCALYVFANVLLLPQFGFAGSAIATAASVVFVSVGGMLLMARIGVVPGKRTLQILLPAAVLYALLSLLSGPPLVQLALAAPLTLVALAAVWRFPSLASIRAEQVALSHGASARTR